MKRSRLVFAVVLGVVAIADTFMQRVDGQAVRAPTVAPLAFVHATVVDGTGAGPKANQTVVVSQGQILVVGPFGSVSIPPGAGIVDVTGKFIIPGLWDLHVHTRYEGIDHLRLFVANGVTGVRDMGGDWRHLDQIRTWQREIAAGTKIGPTLVPVGPLLDGPGSSWSHAHIVSSAEEARSAVKRLKASGVSFAKVYNLLSREAFFAITEEAKHESLIVTGHAIQAVTPAEASDAGQRTFEHLDDPLLLAMTGTEQEFRKRLDAGERVSQAELLASFDPPTAQRLFDTFRKNATRVVPTLSLTAVGTAVARAGPEAFNSERLRYVPIAYVEQWRRGQAGSPEAAEANLREKIKLVSRLRAAGVEMLAGTDVVKPFFVPGFTIHDELALLVQAGLSEMQALQAATSNAARFVGDSSRGTVEAGKVADLLILDRDPLRSIQDTRSISGVVAAGRYYNGNSISGIRRDIEREAAAWNGVPTGR